MFFVRFILFTCLLLNTRESSAAPISDIATIRGLSLEEAKSAQAVEIETQLILLNGNREGGFLYDGEKGIYVHFEEHQKLDPRIRAGSFVQVKGTTHQGNFLPHIRAQSVELLRQLPLPPARELDREQLNLPRYDCAWVTFEGTILEFERHRFGHYYILQVRWQSKTVIVRVMPGKDVKDRLRKLIHQPVRMRAVVATKSNDERQMTMRYFQLPSIEEIEILEPSGQTITSISKGLRYDATDDQIIHLSGTVVHNRDRKLYLLSDDRVVLVRLPRSTVLERGQTITATGLVVAERFGPEVLAYRIEPAEKTSHPVVVADFPIEQDIFSTSWHHRLVKLPAELMGVEKRDMVTVLQCRTNGRTFNASLPSDEILPSAVKPGCQLQLTGICMLDRSSVLPAHFSPADQFEIKLRDSNDLAVLRSAPWWTKDRLLLTLAAIGLVTLISLIWVRTLRQRVARQTHVIGKQVEMEAALKERQRLARELHDTVQQHLTNISMQVDFARLQFSKNQPIRGKDTLNNVLKLVETCQGETREAISRLRSATTQRGSLAAFLDDFMRERARASNVEVEIQTHGEPQEYEPFVLRQILKICREAFLNALRHARPESIAVTFDYRHQGLEVTVQDDGIGFDTQQGAPEGHYGITGMHERAELIGASIKIESQRGQGSILWLGVPASPSVGTLV